MDKIRLVVEVEEDVYDELCSYPQSRVNILYAEENNNEHSDISYPKH